MPANKPGQAPTPKVDSMTIPDDGWEYGNIIIHNWCSQTLYVQSVGAHYLGGYASLSLFPPLLFSPCTS